MTLTPVAEHSIKACSRRGFLVLHQKVGFEEGRKRIQMNFSHAPSGLKTWELIQFLAPSLPQHSTARFLFIQNDQLSYVQRFSSFGLAAGRVHVKPGDSFTLLTIFKNSQPLSQPLVIRLDEIRLFFIASLRRNLSSAVRRLLNVNKRQSLEPESQPCPVTCSVSSVYHQCADSIDYLQAHRAQTLLSCINKVTSPCNCKKNYFLKQRCKVVTKGPSAYYNDEP